MDKLSNIIAFVTVAETGSFAETARRLNLANSVISKRIKDLEDDLGIRLLLRSTRHVRLSDAGYQYFDHARRIINDLAEVEENLRYKNENPVGELSLSAPVSFGTQFLGPAISTYIEKYPDVSIKLHLTDLTVDLKSGGFDLALGIGEMTDTSVITRKIAESRLVIVASPQYLKQHGKPEKPQDLSRHNCMTYNHQNDGRHWPFLLHGKKYMQLVQGKFSCNNGLLLRDAARDDCGITMLPSFIVGEDVMKGRLEILLEEFEQTPLRIFAAWQQQRHLSARTRTFIDHLVGYFSGFGAK